MKGSDLRKEAEESLAEKYREKMMREMAYLIDRVGQAEQILATRREALQKVEDMTVEDFIKLHVGDN